MLFSLAHTKNGPRKHGTRPGFTLIELLITIGIMGTLSAIVVVAIGPSRILGQSEDARRVSSAKQIQNAFQQYAIETGVFPDEADIPTGESNAKYICRQSYSDASCIDANVLATNHLVSLPQDPLEQCEAFSGYKAYKENGRIMIVAAYEGLEANEISLSLECPTATPPTADITDEDSQAVTSPVTVALGSVVQGGSKSTTYTITNTGNVALEITSISITESSGNFTTSFDGQTSVTVAGSSSAPLVIALDTSAIGAVAGTLTFNTSDTAHPSYMFNISGTVTAAAAPDMEVREGINVLTNGTSTVTLESTTEGTAGNPTTITIENTGTADLTISSVNVSNATDFTLNSSLTTITAGNTGTFTVRLSGASQGSPSATVTIDSAELADFTFTVAGTVNAGGGGFSPTDLSGLQLWLKADAGAYSDAGTTLATNGQSVQQWNDQSGNGRNFTQGTSDRRPIFTTNVQNGMPALRFDALNDRMASSYNLSSAPFTVYIVYSYRSSSSANRRAIQGTNNWLLGPYQNLHRFYVGNGFINGPAVVQNTFVTSVGYASGTTREFFLNGVSRGTRTASNVPGTLGLAAQGGFTNETLNGDILEIIVYSNAHDVTDRQQVETYLQTKYGHY